MAGRHLRPKTHDTKAVARAAAQAERQKQRQQPDLSKANAGKVTNKTALEQTRAEKKAAKKQDKRNKRDEDNQTTTTESDVTIRQQQETSATSHATELLMPPAPGDMPGHGADGPTPQPIPDEDDAHTVATQKPAPTKTHDAGKDTGKDWFHVPPHMFNEVGAEKVPFLRPTQGTTFNRDALYAVRMNEAYRSAGAAVENERRYVREAMIRAGTITINKCSGKFPIMILKDFEANPISSGGRATDAAKQRITFTRAPLKQCRAEVLTSPDDPELWRLIGSPAGIAEIAATDATIAGTKAHHVEDLIVAHAFVRPGVLETTGACKTILAEKVRNITGDEAAHRQCTIRFPGANTADVIAAGVRLQSDFLATTTLRTYGVLRVTLPETLSGPMVRKIRAAFPKAKLFTDTPLNEWARDAADDDRPTPHAIVPIPPGFRILKAAADYPAPPVHFERVASALGGRIHQIRPPKFTPTAMSVLIAIPSDAPSPDLGFWETDLGTIVVTQAGTEML